MLSSIEIIVGIAGIVLSGVLFVAALPGRPVNAFLLRNKAAESFYPLAISLPMIAGIALIVTALDPGAVTSSSP